MYVSNRAFGFLQFRYILPIILFTVALLGLASSVQADATGKFVYTQRFDGDAVVLEVEWTYVRATPSLTFGTPRVIWSGVGTEGTAGSDGLFYNPVGDLIVGNHQGAAIWKFDPTKTDEIVEGPVPNAIAFHLLLHPNLDDFLATLAFGSFICGTNSCFGVYDHTALATSNICLTPLESASNRALQPVTFIGDENNNMFTIFSDGRDNCSGCPDHGQGIQFGGGGFASFDLHTTSSTSCSNEMTMTELIPQEIPSAHSLSWDPFLSDANSGLNPHSDFITFANSRMSHIRVLAPGTPGASAEVISTINMASDPNCASLLPNGFNEFDQGAVTGKGIAIVGDEATGHIALIDYSQNTNGTILDATNLVCLTAFLSQGIDDIAPLTGLGSKPGGSDLIFKDSFE